MSNNKRKQSAIEPERRKCLKCGEYKALSLGICGICLPPPRLPNHQQQDNTSLLTKAAATKHDSGKPMMGLISGIFLVGLAKVLTFGARKYSSHNWRKGFQLSRPYDALQRHLLAFWSGEDNDPETGMSHLDHAACELMFLRELFETHKDLDDRYKLAMPLFDAPRQDKEES